jgi:F0F1-type ATP synthase delta subunit
MLSRIQVAKYASEVIIDGDEESRQDMIFKVSAWLKANGRSRQVNYMAKDIAKALSDKGYTLVTITTARPIAESTIDAIKKYLSAKFGHDNKFEIIQFIDPKVVGGVLIDTPNGILDLTIKNKLKLIIRGESV